MYLDPVNEGIEHGVRQLVTVSVLFDQSQKPLGVRLLDYLLLNLGFQFLHPAFQKDLFFIVLLDHPLSLPLRQYPFHGTLVQILNHGVQFSYSFSGFSSSCWPVSSLLALFSSQTLWRSATNSASFSKAYRLTA